MNTLVTVTINGLVPFTRREPHVVGVRLKATKPHGAHVRTPSSV
jgi:hypothetical protein